MSEYIMEVPDGWRRLEHLCYPRNGSKGYKSNNTKANIHLVNMYETGLFVVNGEDKYGKTFDKRWYDYFAALSHAREWMLEHE